MTSPGEIATDKPALVYTIHNLLLASRVSDALGAFWLTTPCQCARFSQGIDGWSVVTVEPGLQLHLCGTCGKPTNKAALLPPTPYAKGDVAFWCELLWTIANDPGPTGMVTLRPLDSDDTVQVHMLQLNLEA